MGERQVKGYAQRYTEISYEYQCLFVSVSFYHESLSIASLGKHVFDTCRRVFITNALGIGYERPTRCN